MKFTILSLAALAAALLIPAPRADAAAISKVGIESASTTQLVAQKKGTKHSMKTTKHRKSARHASTPKSGKQRHASALK